MLILLYININYELKYTGDNFGSLITEGRLIQKFCDQFAWLVFSIKGKNFRKSSYDT